MLNEMLSRKANITIQGETATIDKPVVLYRGDRNIKVKFTIMENPYSSTGFFRVSKMNVIEENNISYGRLVIKRENGLKPLATDIAATEEGAIILTIKKEMIDEIAELGAYDFHLVLYNENKSSKATLPAVEGGIIVKEPIEVINETTIGGATVEKGEELPVFDSSGNYIKSNWEEGTLIDSGKMNKIEKAIYKNNSQIKEKAAIGEVRENTSIKPINHTEFDTETKQLFTGGAVAVVGEKAVGEENLKDYAVTSGKRTTTGSLAKICSLSNTPIMLDIINKILILPETDFNLIYYNNKFDKLTSGLTIDVSGNDTTCSLYYDTLAKTFKVFETDTLNDNCIFIGTVYWNNTTGEYVNSDLNCDYVLKNDNEQNSRMLGKINSNSIYPQGKSIRVFSQNPLNIDLVNKKLKIDKTGYCKVLVDGYLVNVQEDEIDISIDAHHVSILYDKANNRLFSSTLVHGENDTNRNNYLLGVIDIEKPYKSTLQCDFTVDGISYEQYVLSLNIKKRWTSKKIGCLGDSITFGAGGTSWVTKLPELTGCKEAINYGISGTCVEENGTGKSFVERYSSMADDLDLICVWGGVNDHHWTGTSGRVFGDINTPSSQINTFYGALKNLCEGLLDKYPTKNIMFITPMKNRGYVAGSTTCPAWNEQNGINKTLTDYRNAVIEVCDFYSIPVLDLYTLSGISPENENQVQNLMPDRLHPNTKGNLEILAPKIASFMNNL